MSILSIDQIRQAIDEGKLVIRPFNDRLVRPASIILRLGDEIIRFQKSSEVIDPFEEQSIVSTALPVEKFADIVLHSKSFALSVTTEHIGVPNNLLGVLSNLSHLARLGLDVHHGSSLLHPGFGLISPSTLTLELYNQNISPIKLYAGMPICHLCFLRVEMPSKSYDEGIGTYTGQKQPQLSRYYKEFSEFKSIEKQE